MLIKNPHVVLILVLISLAFTSSVSAASKSNKELTSDLATMQNNVARMQKDMQRLQRLLDNRAMLELFQRMDDLSDEVSQLRGQMEQQSHDLAGLKKRQRELYLDTDRRLRELEITSNRAPVSAPPVLPSTPAVEPSAAAQTTTPAAVVSKPPASTKPATINNKAKPSVTVSAEREDYQKAFDMLKEGRYKMANSSFRGFLSKFPQSSYAGNAQYWLGESNYVTKKFEQAINEFDAVLKQYPSSNKVPDAMLKLGYTYYELRQFEKAKNILQQLRQKYPKRSAARLAGKRLERMKKEGH